MTNKMITRKLLLVPLFVILLLDTSFAGSIDKRVEKIIDKCNKLGKIHSKDKSVFADYNQLIKACDILSGEISDTQSKIEIINVKAMCYEKLADYPARHNSILTIAELLRRNYGEDSAANYLAGIADDYYEWKKRDYVFAEKFYKEVADKFPDSQPASYCRFKLAECYWETKRLCSNKDVERAVEEYAKLIEKYRDGIWTKKSLIRLGDIYKNKNEKENKMKAVSYFRKAMDTSPKDYEDDYIHFVIGSIEYEMGNYNTAIEELKITLNRYPDSSYADECKRLIQEKEEQPR